MRAAGDQAGEMRHVDHQDGANRVGDLAEAPEIENARIGRPTGDDHLGRCSRASFSTSSKSIR